MEYIRIVKPVTVYMEEIMTPKERFQELIDFILGQSQYLVNKDRYIQGQLSARYSDVLFLDSKLQKMLEEHTRLGIEQINTADRIFDYVKSRQK